MPFDPSRDQYDVNPKVIAKYAGGAIVLGISVVLCQEARTVGTIWALACLMVGTLAGLLFGVPRSQQGKVEDAQQYGQRDNTNLEEISDWLTKILVGLGLTQLGTIRSMLQDAAAYMGKEMGGAAYHSAFAYGLMLYFGIVGFIAGYLLTRIFLPRMFQKARPASESIPRLAQQIGTPAPPTNIFSGGLKTATDVLTGKLPDDPRQIANQVVLRTSQLLDAFHDLERKAEPSVLKKDISELEELKKEMPTSRLLYILLGRLYRWTGDLDTGIRSLTEFIANKKQTGNDHDDDAAMAYFNRACYYALKMAETNDESFGGKAIADLKTTVAIAPRYKQDVESDSDLDIIRKKFPDEVAQLVG